MNTPVFHQNKAENLAFFVGDIHGQYDLLMEALHDAGFEPKKGHLLFSVGDLIDRGPKNIECLRLLDQPWFYAIRGNHEDLMIKTVLGNCQKSESVWAMNGGGWAAEYLLSTPEDRLGGRFAEELTAYAEKLAGLPYLREVKAAQTNQRLLCVHAEIPKDADLKALNTDSLSGDLEKHENLVANLIWKRTLSDQVGRMQHLATDDDALYFQASQSDDTAPNYIKSDLVISGHTPLGKKPVMTGRQIFIDTGAARGRKPTVLNEIELRNIRKRHRQLEQSLQHSTAAPGP